MNNYDFINKIGTETFIQLVQRGLIPIHIMDYKSIYETYLNEMLRHKKSISILYCAEHYNVHENTIRNIIKFMEL